MLAPSPFDEKVRAGNTERISIGLIALACTLAALIFTTDLLLPLGEVGGVPYAAVVLIGMWSRWRPLIFLLAGLGTALTVLGYAYTPAGGEFWSSITNRGLAVFIIWAAAFVVLGSKRVEARLRDEEERTRSILNTLVDGVVTINQSGIVTSLNSAAITMFGYTAEEVIGNNVKMLMTERDQNWHDGYLEQYLKTGNAKIIGSGREVVGRRKDGTTFSLDLGISEAIISGKAGYTGILREITERKKSENALRHSEFQLRLLADSLPGQIISLDRDLKFRFANKAYCEIHGYTQEGILGLDFREIIGETGYRNLQPNIDAALSGQSVEFETTYKFVDGIERDIVASYVPEVDESGTVLGLYVMLIDVTERNRAVEELHQSVAQMRLVTDALPVLIAYIDIDRRFRFVNETAEIWFANPRADIIGKSIVEIFGETQAERTVPTLERVESGETVEQEFTESYPDGVTRFVKMNIVPDFDATGEFRGHFALFQDFSQRKQSETALRNSEFQLRLLANNLPVMIISLDPQLLFRFANTAYCEAHGRSLEEIVGKDLRDVLGKSAYNKLKPNIDAALAGRAVEFETHYEFGDGIERYVEASYIPELDQQGAVRGLFVMLADITERRSAEVALKESEETLNAFFSNAPLGMALYDADLRYLKINELSAWNSDFSVDEHIGKSLAEIKPTATKVLEPIYRRLFETGVSNVNFEVQEELPSDQGALHWWSAFAFPTSWVDGKPSTIGVVALDITERKRIEEEVRATAENLDAILKASPLAIHAADFEGRILNWNPASQATFGWREDEVVGKFNPLIPENERETYIQRVTNTAKGKPALGEELTRRRKDGTMIDVAVWTAPIRDASDKIVGSLAVLQDITERRRAEEALKESEARLDAFFTNAPIGLVLWDDQQRYVKVNDVAAEWHSLATKDHIGRTKAEALPAYEKTDKASFQHIMDTGKPVLNQEFVSTLRARPNDEMTLLVSRFPIPGTTGKPVGVASIILDITEQKRAREEVRNLNAKLEQRVEKRTAELRTAQAELVRKERLATLGQLSATVSHELRNPLGTIRNSLVILEKKLGTESPVVHRSIDRMVRNIGRCNNIIDEMLEFARARELELNKTNFDAWLVNILDEFQVPPGITVTRLLGAPRSRPGIDDDRMRRAIVNVYDNACQAMTEEPKGKGPAKKKALTVSTKSVKGRLEVLIADTGPGMPPEVFAAAFEPLYSTKGFGVGLGLPIVKQIMEQHGGGIEITSKQGIGTQVVLWLPLGKSANKVKREAQ